MSRATTTGRRSATRTAMPSRGSSSVTLARDRPCARPAVPDGAGARRGRSVTLKVKSLLHALGPRLAPRLRRRLVSAAGALEFGAWVKEQGYDRCPSVGSREELFRTVATEIADE